MSSTCIWSVIEDVLAQVSAVDVSWAAMLHSVIDAGWPSKLYSWLYPQPKLAEGVIDSSVFPETVETLNGYCNLEVQANQRREEPWAVVVVVEAGAGDGAGSGDVPEGTDADA